MSNINLHNRDCLEAMKEMDDNSFDLAIVDPPYGIKQDGHRANDRNKLAKTTNFHKALWSQPKPTPEYFEQLFRVSKNQVIWGGNHLADLIGRFSPCWLVWDKHTTGGFADCELAYTSFTTAVRKFDYTWNGMIQGKSGKKWQNEIRIHPTQKPIILYEWVLINYAKKGYKILDTHCGSGSIMIACDRLGFDLEAFELEKVHYLDALKRFKQITAQLRIS